MYTSFLVVMRTSCKSNPNLNPITLTEGGWGASNLFYYQDILYVCRISCMYAYFTLEEKLQKTAYYRGNKNWLKIFWITADKKPVLYL
jgi:hypothetical protein